MNRARTLLAAAALALTVGACGWPSSGTGGMAERGRPATPAVEQASATIERMKQSGAEKYAPADLIEARLVLTRAERELAGGLSVAAESDLVRLNVILERIDQRLAAGPLQAGRVRVADGAPHELP